jgi:hypothetical protein
LAEEKRWYERMRQAHDQNGEYFDILLMSVLRSEWDQ